jgi:hypothetical protein
MQYLLGHVSMFLASLVDIIFQDNNDRDLATQGSKACRQQ